MANPDLHNVGAPTALAKAAAPSYAEGTVNGLSQTLGGALRTSVENTITTTSGVVGNGAAATAARVTIANDSTGIVAATLSAETSKVIGTVNPGNTANTTAWLVTQGAAATGGYSFLNIAAGQATTVVKASAGTLHSITLNSAATATNTTVVYDHASGVGTVIARPNVVAATVPTTLIFDLAFAAGLTIITAAANGGDMTVTFK